MVILGRTTAEIISIQKEFGFYVRPMMFCILIRTQCECYDDRIGFIQTITKRSDVCLVLTILTT